MSTKESLVSYPFQSSPPSQSDLGWALLPTSHVANGPALLEDLRDPGQMDLLKPLLRSNRPPGSRLHCDHGVNGKDESFVEQGRVEGE